MESIYIIDRFEGEFAVCERKDEQMIQIAKKELPEQAKEGDILICKDGKYTIDYQKTRDRKKEIEDLTKDLWI